MAELSNQRHINLSERQAAFMDSFLLSIPTPSKMKQSDFPSLQEDIQGPHDVVDVPIAEPQDVHHHVIPGPGGVIGDGDAVNQQLLQEDMLDTQGSQERCSFFNKSIEQIQTVCAAARTILGQEIPQNGITVKQHRWILLSLRDHLKLQAAQPHKIPHEEAHARILNRLAHRLTTLTNHQSVALSYRPLGYVECLDKLLNDMEAGFMVMQQTGNEDDVYIIADIKEPVGYSERLSSLASYLRHH